MSESPEELSPESSGSSEERERREETNDAASPPPPGGPGRTDAPSGPLTAGGPAHEDDTTTRTEGQ